MIQKTTRSSGGSFMRRSLVTVATTAVVVAATGLPAAALDNYPEDKAEAAASVLDADLTEKALLDAGYSKAGSETNPGPNAGNLNVDLLGKHLIELGDVTVPLDQLVDFGEAGALGSESSASSPGDAYAVSGLVGADGGVELDSKTNKFGKAYVDVTQAAQDLGIDGLTDQVVDELKLEVGAAAAEVEAKDGVILDQDGKGGLGQYRVADLDLNLHSPLLEDVLGGIDLPKVGNTVDSDNGLVTIDLSAGVIVVHLDQLVEGGLNEQPANTKLLTADSADKIAATVTDLLADVLGDVIDVPVAELGLDLVGDTVAALPIEGLLVPVFDALNEIVSITINQQVPGTESGAASEETSFELTALNVVLLPGETPLANVDLGNAGVRITPGASDEPTDGPTDGPGDEPTDGPGDEPTDGPGDEPGDECAADSAIVADPTSVMAGDEVKVTGTGFTAGSEVVVQLKDSEGNNIGDPVTVTVNDECGFTTTITVPEDTTPGDYDVDADPKGDDEGASTPLEVVGGDAGDGDLAATGANIWTAVGIAVLLLGAGTFLLMRRRKLANN